MNHTPTVSELYLLRTFFGQKYPYTEKLRSWYGASTARVRYKYSPNTKLTRFLHLNFPRIKPFGTMFIINE
ncbi:hypothetical protein HMPREF2531_04642 [Bacteroides intestinalis]|uniref:Uncharacterized protein n=1 Tax=Bacteroides intestinalis TaxID=329854 RepID=A0A139KTQ0_9BACE|nr:hypothetical protein HMPREF2531_04642 [Bacteroides intestinalis]